LIRPFPVHELEGLVMSRALSLNAVLGALNVRDATEPLIGMAET